ncbi:methyl-accepting chemotaxis protein [Brevibacillus dissolubilis]|uniref:methyl-accepting chemotaxis protein n=1 Tax=Brevibacillus dissolubilis TaxID=1844116 RepID=UPI00159BA7E9|nr:methyl-accepting chemotaxis protein [Brevibacillus dissolubilis]
MLTRIRYTIPQKIWTTYAVILLLLAFVGISNYAAFHSMVKNNDDIVLDAIPVGKAAANLLPDLVNQQSGIRGYLVTADESYLTPYLEGQKQLEQDLATIAKYEDKHPIMKQLIHEEALPLIEKLNQYFESQIKLVQSGRIEEARAKIDNGKTYMEQFREVNVKIQADIDKLTNDAWNASKESSDEAIMSLLAGGVAILITIIASGIILNILITRPIRQVQQQLQDIAEGEGDLTRQLEVKTNDELGDLAHAFNKMVSNLRTLIKQVGYNTEQVAASAEQLTASSEQTSAATEQIATTIQKVALGAESQERGVQTSELAIDEMSYSLSHINDTSQVVSRSAQESARMALEGNKAVQQAITQMNSIQHQADELAGFIQQLGEHSQKIDQIVKVISDIAGQTNLLALNAAIEAARAGEHGRGFAVVAEEVRKLAEESAQSAQKITQLISTIQTITESAVHSMDKSQQEVTEGIQAVSQVSNMFAHIRTSVDAVSRQIGDVSTSVEQITSRNSDINQSIQMITQVAKTTSAETQSAAAASQEQLASMEEVAASAHSLSKMAEELQSLVGKFKV